MEEKQVSGGNLPLESSLTDLILKPNSEKIRRPPNAFMLFARDHRKILAQRHSDVSNKEISTMLGKIWKESTKTVKEKYFEKARMLDDMHKSRYPNYIYSPREARLKKQNKKRKKGGITAAFSGTVPGGDLDAVMKNSKHEVQPIKEENWIIDNTNQDTEPSPPQYVPNNPEYFTHQSPETNDEDDPNPQPIFQHRNESEFRDQQSSEMPMSMDLGRADKKTGCRLPPISERCGCCTQDRLESNVKCVPPYARGKDEAEPHLPNHLRCSHPPFCNTSAPCPGPMRPFYYAPAACTSATPRPYAPQFRYHPYWGTPVVNPHCFQGRECRCEDVKPFPYHAPYPTSGFYRHAFGYFGRPGVPPQSRYPNPGIYPHSHDNWDHLRGLPNEFASGNPAETYSGVSNSNEKGDNLSNSYACSSTSEAAARFESGSGVQRDEQNNDCSAPYKPEPKPVEMTDSCSSACGAGGFYSLMGLENQYGLYNQMHYFIRNPEDDRKEPASNEWPGNPNIRNADRHKIESEGYLANLDDNKAHENAPGSITSPSVENIPKSIHEHNVHAVKDINYSDAFEPKSCKPPHLVSLKSTPSRKTNTGIHSLFASNQFQGMCYRPCQLIRNSSKRMPIDYNLEPSAILNKTTSEIGSSIKEAMDTIKNNHDLNFEPICTDIKKPEDMSMKFFNTVSNTESLPKLEINDTMTVARPSEVKAEINISDSCPSKDIINKGICVIELDKEEGKKHISNAVDEYSKNLSESLKCEQNYANAGKNDLKYIKQQDLPKTYYKQNDGSYVAEKILTLK